MKKKIIYISTLISILITTSCNDILDTSPDNQQSSSKMWTTEASTKQGMNGIYEALREPVRAEGGFVGNTSKLGYYAWDVLGMTAQTRLNAGGIFSSGVNAGNTLFSKTWEWAYTGVNRANDAITNLDKSPIEAPIKDKYFAEAKILRAFFYMKLNELYGRGIGVPIYDYVVEPTTANRPQSSESEVWDFIINDLTEAIASTNLPNNTIGPEGTVSKGAAYALRGRAYLLRSQSLGVNDYQKAIDDFEQVELMGYTLFNGSYADLFKVKNENCAEMIFSVQNIEDPIKFGSQIQKFAAPWNAGAASGGSCWTDIQFTPAIADLYEVIVDPSTSKEFNWDDYISGYNSENYDNRQVYFVRDSKKNGLEILPEITAIVNSTLNKFSNKSLYLPEGNEARIRKAYDNRDPRLEASMITPYSTFLGLNNASPTSATMYTFRWPSYGKYYTDMAKSETSLVPGMNTTLVANGSQYFYYMFRKFIGVGLEYSQREYNPIDEPIIRFADVLLMKAEALVELNKLTEAQAAVKRVRDRVNMPTMSKYFVNQTTARNYVRDERRRELVGEGVNFFDEMRWKTLKETKFEYGPKSSMQVWGGIATGNPSYQWTEAWYTWPVPRFESEKNPNLKRTPGWIY